MGIRSADIDGIEVSATGEPKIETISFILQLVSDTAFDCVLGMGGGSVIDTAKAVSAMLSNQGEVRDYLEIIGRNLPLQNNPVPFIAVPTTAGTGSEVTRNAVLTDPDTGIKVSLRNQSMVPKVALIDPELTVTMPQAVTAATGMDAIVQLIEPFLSVKAVPFTDAICREGLTTASRSIFAAFQNGNNIPAREGMCYASLCGGMALANAGLGAVHGFAGVIGGRHSIPHGVICASLLAGVLQGNLSKIQRSNPQAPILSKFQEISAILTGDPAVEPSDCVKWAETACQTLEIERLSEMGISREDFPGIVEKAANSSSMKGNPVPLSHEELLEILEFSF